MKQSIRTVFAYTLVFSLVGILCFEIEQDIAFYFNKELPASQFVPLKLISSLLEENDRDDSIDHLIHLKEVTLNEHFLFIHFKHLLITPTNEHLALFAPYDQLYIRFRRFRI